MLLTSLSLMKAQEPIVINLWPNGAPNSNGLTGTEEDLKGGRVANVVNPSITVYLPAKPNGMTILMCPGGGYARLAMNHEGHDMAPWMNAQGITYVVLKYRMPNGHHEVPLSDAEQAMRLIRQHAQEWNINPQQVGVMGASAGGHLAASLATLYTSDETRPDFQVLFYPVITMDPGFSHKGSHDNFLGKNARKKDEQLFSNDMQVTRKTPRAWVALSDDDTVVPAANGFNYYFECYRHDVPASLHVYPTGGHGWGIRPSFQFHAEMLQELKAWLMSF